MTDQERPYLPRKSDAGKYVAKYIDSNNLRVTTLAMPREMRNALKRIGAVRNLPVGTLISEACEFYYGGEHALPPLVASGRPVLDKYPRFTWYPSEELYTRIRLLAIDIRGSIIQLALSAVVDYLKDCDDIKALNIKTGYPPMTRPMTEEEEAKYWADVSAKAADARRNA